MEDFKTEENSVIKQARETLNNARDKFLEKKPQIHRQRCRGCRELFLPEVLNEDRLCLDCQSMPVPAKRTYHRKPLRPETTEEKASSPEFKQCFFCESNLFQIIKDNNVIKCVQCDAVFSQK